jgi:hypothetical protein
LGVLGFNELFEKKGAEASESPGRDGAKMAQKKAIEE